MTTFPGLPKLTFDGEAFTWDGNQVAYTEGSDTVVLGMTDEDFENGEFTDEQAADVTANKDAILAAIRSLGFTRFEDEQ